MKKVIYTTTNPGKFSEVKSLFAEQGIVVHLPREFGVEIDVDETGSTLEENAILKAEAYINAVPSDCILLGDDTGVEIDALGGEPGIKVRRWKGYKMSDAEIREYCLERMKDVPLGQRQAHFRTVIAVAAQGYETRIFEGTLHGSIVGVAAPQVHEGFPFESLFYVDPWGKLIGEIYALSASEREKFKTHRHAAVSATIPYLRSLIGL